MSLNTLRWDEGLLSMCGGPHLRSKLAGEPVPGGTILGHVGKWWVDRYNFSPGALANTRFQNARLIIVVQTALLRHSLETTRRQLSHCHPQVMQFFLWAHQQHYLYHYPLHLKLSLRHPAPPPRTSLHIQQPQVEVSICYAIR